VPSNLPSDDRSAVLHARSRERGVNPLVYWLIRALFQPFFHLYFRLSRIGREHIPQSGPVIFCSNHRSFLDPFVIGTIARRPMYYVAKQELFEYHPILSWLLNALGAFPVRRGTGDQDMLETARILLERGECVLIFSEGTRIRPGALGRPKRGVGRLALETGAPVVPVAVIGTETVRKGWRIRPHKVRIRIGSPLTFPKVEQPSPQLAAAVTDRIWPNVMLQWEWLGGLPPLRRAAVIGAGRWGTAVATMLARSGLEVDLGCHTAEQAARLHGELPAGIAAVRAADLALSRHDLVCFAVPAAALPAAVAEHAPNIARRAGVLVLSKGLVGPLATLPGAYVAERTEAWATGVVAGPASAEAVLRGHASLVVAATDPGFRRQVTEAFGSAGYDVLGSADVVGVELAGCARDAAALAAATAAHAGRAAAGSAAGKVFAELDTFARRQGAAPGTFAGLAGAGDLVAAVLGDGTGDAEHSVPLLAARVRDTGVDAPVLRGLAGVLDGSVEPERWTAALTAPRPARRDAVKAA
jgi:1-acyl-sn-glycerol-3-phosphate acyltransferase